MNLPFFIANRIYSNDGDRQKVSRPAIRIATLGVAIGLAVMIVSVAVVIGFKHSIRDKVVGFGSHITIANYFSLQSQEDEPIQITDSLMKQVSGMDGVCHVQRYAVTQGILKTDSDFLGVAFKGVAEEFDSTFISSNLCEGKIPSFSSSKSNNEIIISKIMADKLHIEVGDKIFGYFLTNGDVRMRRYVVSGIYQTNLTKFDETICFADLYSIVKLNGWKEDQASGLEVTVHDIDKIDDTYNIIIDSINKKRDKYFDTYSSATTQEINPQIFTWLDLLDLNVWIILALMVCVAGVTMISGLLIIILERVQMIGVMKAIGARNRVIRHTFLWFSVFIIGKGLVLGNIIGIGVCLVQKWFGIVTLDPATYYVSKAPVEISIPLIIALNVATLIVCVFVLVVPSFFVSHIHPARSMRYE